MFKDGEMLICVNDKMEIPHRNFVNFINNGLTSGKVYKVIQPVFRREGYVHIRNDRGETQDYHNEFFVSLLQFRRLKLEKICSKLVI